MVLVLEHSNACACEGPMAAIAPGAIALGSYTVSTHLACKPLHKILVGHEQTVQYIQEPLQVRALTAIAPNSPSKFINNKLL